MSDPSSLGRLELGFLVFLDHAGDAGALGALTAGLELFQVADELGYDSGWVRVRHHERTLSAPFPFLAAAGARTTGIRLGTAVIPLGYEDTLRFAEDAATTDLLTGGRLEIGVSSGLGDRSSADAEAHARLLTEQLERLPAALRGEPLGEPYVSRLAPAAASGGSADPATGPVRDSFDPVAYPTSPGLADRLWYGSGSTSSALRAAALGYDLIVSTLNGEATGPTLGDTQADQIARYREAFAKAHPERTPRVAVSRSFLPIVGADDERAFRPLADRYADLVDESGRMRGAPPHLQWSKLLSGDPADIAAQIDADPAVALADTVLLNPVTELDTIQKIRVLTTVRNDVAPLLARKDRP